MSTKCVRKCAHRIISKEGKICIRRGYAQKLTANEWGFAQELALHEWGFESGICIRKCCSADADSKGK